MKLIQTLALTFALFFSPLSIADEASSAQAEILLMMPTLMGKGGQLGARRVQANMEELRQMIETESRRLQAEQEAPSGATQ